LIKRLQKIKAVSKGYQSGIKRLSKRYQKVIKAVSKGYQKVIKAVSIEIPRIKPPQIRFKRLFQN
jgi:ribosome modulation factor